MTTITYPKAISMMITEVVDESYKGKSNYTIMYMVQHQFSAKLPESVIAELQKKDKFDDGVISRSAIFQFMIYCPGNSPLVLMRRTESPTVLLESEFTDWTLLAYHDEQWGEKITEIIATNTCSEREKVITTFKKLAGREPSEEEMNEKYIYERSRYHVYEPKNMIGESNHFVVCVYSENYSKSTYFRTRERHEAQQNLVTPWNQKNVDSVSKTETTNTKEK